MERCPVCKSMTAQKDLYTGELVCYGADCYEAGVVALDETIKEKADLLQRCYDSGQTFSIETFFQGTVYVGIKDSTTAPSHWTTFGSMEAACAWLAKECEVK